jgi:hypothetical protein
MVLAPHLQVRTVAREAGRNVRVGIFEHATATVKKALD